MMTNVSCLFLVLPIQDLERFLPFISNKVIIHVEGYPNNSFSVEASNSKRYLNYQ
jgi:hypothetical protein